MDIKITATNATVNGNKADMRQGKYSDRKTVTAMMKAKLFPKEPQVKTINIRNT